MRTLAPRGGARVTVVAADWCDVFDVVTRGRVQQELRDGKPGPVRGRDAGSGSASPRGGPNGRASEEFTEAAARARNESERAVLHRRANPNLDLGADKEGRAQVGDYSVVVGCAGE